MKGYQIENVLYIFPQDAAQIPSVAETVEAIAIQPEMLEAFKALNEDYADIMVPYNYNTMTVNAKPWAGHTDDDIEVEPEPVLPEAGTVFNFTGYLHVDDETPSSTGTVTYGGIYEGTPESDLPTDGTYVYGTANVTFADETTAEAPVFILRSDFSTLLDGGRVPVKSINSSDPTTTADFGYGEFTAQESEP